MNKSMIPWITTFLLLVGVIFLAINAQQQKKEIKTVESKLVVLKSQNDQLKTDKGELNESTSNYREQVAKMEKQLLNTGKDVDLNQEYEKTVKELFETLINFSPSNYGEKKKQAENYYSDELKKQFQGDQRNYSDSNGVTSKLEYIDIFSKSVQEGEMKGIVVEEHESGMSTDTMKKGRAMFLVSYDINTKKITELKNLGSGVAVELLK